MNMEALRKEYGRILGTVITDSQLLLMELARLQLIDTEDEDIDEGSPEYKEYLRNRHSDR